MVRSLARILYVEDQPAVAAVIALELELANIRVTTALNGEEGLALAREQQFDLILLDQLLPGVDGIEICTRLKGDAALQEIPVIFFTAYPNQACERIASRLGAVDYLLKGIHSARLAARILAEVELARDRTKHPAKNAASEANTDTQPPPITN